MQIRSVKQKSRYSTSISFQNDDSQEYEFINNSHKTSISRFKIHWSLHRIIDQLQDLVQSLLEMSRS